MRNLQEPAQKSNGMSDPGRPFGGRIHFADVLIDEQSFTVLGRKVPCYFLKNPCSYGQGIRPESPRKQGFSELKRLMRWQKNEKIPCYST
jgi:hypothetical protein